jgi:hypothetical protein
LLLLVTRREYYLWLAFYLLAGQKGGRGVGPARAHLAAKLGEEFVEIILVMHHLHRLQLNVRRLTPRSAERLMDLFPVTFVSLSKQAVPMRCYTCLTQWAGRAQAVLHLCHSVGRPCLGGVIAFLSTAFLTRRIDSSWFT